MFKNSIKKVLVTAIILVGILSIDSPASLLDTSNPYWSQNHPLGRNPARAAYLKKQNRFNIAYTLSNEHFYTENFERSVSFPGSTFKKIDVEPINNYTNTLSSISFPLGSEYFYIGLIENQVEHNRRLNYIPASNRDVYLLEHLDRSLIESQAGITMAFPLFSKNIFFGFEALQGNDTFDETEVSIKQGDPIPLNNYNKRSIWTFETGPFQYYTYTTGFLVNFDKSVLSLTQTITTPKYFRTTWKNIDNMNPANSYSDTSGHTMQSPPVTGVSYIFNDKGSFSVGIGSEFFQHGIGLEGGLRVITKPFTRYSIGIENQFTNFFSVRTFGSVIEKKDARTNMYDYGLLGDKRAYASADDHGDWDNENFFNEEEFGIDLEFRFFDSISTIIGAAKKNYIFYGNKPPYGIALAAEDSRCYFGLSIIGIFQPDDKVDQENVSGNEDENGNTVKVSKKKKMKKQASTSEDISISSRVVFPGDEIKIVVREGEEQIFSTSAALLTNSKEKSIALTRTDTGVWEGNVVIPESAVAGIYRIKVSKLYDDLSEESSTVRIQVKDLDERKASSGHDNSI